MAISFASFIILGFFFQTIDTITLFKNDIHLDVDTQFVLKGLVEFFRHAAFLFINLALARDLERMDRLVSQNDHRVKFTIVKSIIKISSTLLCVSMGS